LRRKHPSPPTTLPKVPGRGVLAVGQAAGAIALRVEERALNLDDFPMPDNAGNHHRKQIIVPDGPSAYRATLRNGPCLPGLWIASSRACAASWPLAWMPRACP
jgi:hypothetical protein